MLYRKIKGEITVFLTLLFFIVSAFILTVVESARIQAIRVQTERVMQGSIHSVFGEYNQDLLLKYDLFAIDSSYRGSSGSVENVRIHLAEYVQENYLSSDANKQKSDWLKLHAQETKILQYQLLSDENGAVLIDQAVRVERERGQLPNRSDILHAMNSMRSDDGSAFLSAFADYLSRAGDVPDNPAKEVFETAAGTDLLELVLWGGYQGEFMEADCASRRFLKTGTYQGLMVYAGNDTFLFDAYLQDRFGNHTDPKDHAVFESEQEYLIAAKSSESDSLRECAKRILAQREDITLDGFLGNEEILLETEKLAERLCENGGDPYYMQMSLVYAWTYAESVIEVSRLLYGGRAPMDAYEMPTVPLDEVTDFTDYCYACGNSSGETYQDFLSGLLAQVPTELKAKRCMDLIEMNLHHLGHEGFRVDTSITCFRARMSALSDYGHGCEIEREYGYYLNL